MKTLRLMVQLGAQVGGHGSGGLRWEEESETWPSFHTELPGSPVGSGNFGLLLLPVQRPVLFHVSSHLVVLWKTESLLLELKSH